MRRKLKAKHIQKYNRIFARKCSWMKATSTCVSWYAGETVKIQGQLVWQHGWNRTFRIEWEKID